MQGIQFTIPTLQDHGPIIEAEIHTDEETFLNVKNFNGFHTYITTRLLIDTGSNISGLDKTIIQRLQLTQYRDDATIDGAGGRYELKLFRGILYLPISEKKHSPLISWKAITATLLMMESLAAMYSGIAVLYMMDGAIPSN